ncbi:MAG: hypothetical protein FWG66_15100 [Spirochaetes bacterium]|nr:hypothetical protein [Spirochaetota bacterium]
MNRVAKFAISVVLIVGLIISWGAASRMDFNATQDQGRQQQELTRRITEVLRVWAGVRAASGAISIIQTIQVEGSVPLVGGAAVSVQPLGWADVVNNTLDKISNILLWAVGALTIQKLLLAISMWVSFRIIVPICLILILLLLWNKKYAEQLKKTIAGVIVITVAICVAVPLSLELATVVESNILHNHINQTVSEVEGLAGELEGAGGQVENLGFLRGLLGGITNFFAALVQRFWDLIDRTINFIMVFIVVNILIPIGTLFLLKWLVVTMLSYIGFSIAHSTPPLLEKKAIPIEDDEPKIRTRSSK